MPTLHTDVIVIGAGTAGLNARREVEEAGGNALLIESGHYGTTCARVGCMPSKLLIAAAEVAHVIADAERFGIQTASNWSVHGKAVMERVRRERDRFTGFVVKATEEIPEAQRLRGRARFLGPSSVQVDGGPRIEGRAVVVATGSSPWVPPPFKADGRQVLVSDDLFELEELPQSMAVIGTGVVGLELGQALMRLGVRVSFFNPSQGLGPLTDPAVKRVAREVLSADLPLHHGAQVLGVEQGPAGVDIRWRDRTGTTHKDQFATVLAAAGRQPNLAGLNLERTGLVLDANGRPPWDPRTTQCGDLPIFLAGDASGHRPLLHEASDEGRIAGLNALRYPEVCAHVRRESLTIVFTEPQMAVVGTRYADLDPNEVEIGEVSYADQGRARVMGRNAGLVRIYARRKRCTLLGAEMFGPRVEHLAHLLAWAVQQGLSVQQSLQMPFYHPVFEEGLRTALRDLSNRLLITSDCRAEDLADAPGA
jgi:dihydrolipoamide dehydrogenase